MKSRKARVKNSKTSPVKKSLRSSPNKLTDVRDHIEPTKNDDLKIEKLKDVEYNDKCDSEQSEFSIDNRENCENSSNANDGIPALGVDQCSSDCVLSSGKWLSFYSEDASKNRKLSKKELKAMLKQTRRNKIVLNEDLVATLNELSDKLNKCHLDNGFMTYKRMIPISRLVSSQEARLHDYVPLQVSWCPLVIPEQCHFLKKHNILPSVFEINSTCLRYESNFTSGNINLDIPLKSPKPILNRLHHRSVSKYLANIERLSNFSSPLLSHNTVQHQSSTYCQSSTTHSLPSSSGSIPVSNNNVCEKMIMQCGQPISSMKLESSSSTNTDEFNSLPLCTSSTNMSKDIGSTIEIENISPASFDNNSEIDKCSTEDNLISSKPVVEHPRSMTSKQRKRSKKGSRKGSVDVKSSSVNRDSMEACQLMSEDNKPKQQVGSVRRELRGLVTWASMIAAEEQGLTNSQGTKNNIDMLKQTLDLQVAGDFHAGIGINPTSSRTRRTSAGTLPQTMPNQRRNSETGSSVASIPPIVVPDKQLPLQTIEKMSNENDSFKRIKEDENLKQEQNLTDRPSVPKETKDKPPKTVVTKPGRGRPKSTAIQNSIPPAVVCESDIKADISNESMHESAAAVESNLSNVSALPPRKRYKVGLQDAVNNAQQASVVQLNVQSNSDVKPAQNLDNPKSNMQAKVSSTSDVVKVDIDKRRRGRTARKAALTVCAKENEISVIASDSSALNVDVNVHFEKLSSKPGRPKREAAALGYANLVAGSINSSATHPNSSNVTPTSVKHESDEEQDLLLGGTQLKGVTRSSNIKETISPRTQTESSVKSRSKNKPPQSECQNDQSPRGRKPQHANKRRISTAVEQTDETPVLKISRLEKEAAEIKDVESEYINAIKTDHKVSNSTPPVFLLKSHKTYRNAFKKLDSEELVSIDSGSSVPIAAPGHRIMAHELSAIPSRLQIYRDSSLDTSVSFANFLRYDSPVVHLFKDFIDYPDSVEPTCRIVAPVLRLPNIHRYAEFHRFASQCNLPKNMPLCLTSIAKLFTDSDAISNDDDELSQISTNSFKDGLSQLDQYIEVMLIVWEAFAGRKSWLGRRLCLLKQKYLELRSIHLLRQKEKGVDITGLEAPNNGILTSYGQHLSTSAILFGIVSRKKVDRKYFEKGCEVIKCLCGFRVEGGHVMVQCDACASWQHLPCLWWALHCRINSQNLLVPKLRKKSSDKTESTTQSVLNLCKSALKAAMAVGLSNNASKTNDNDLPYFCTVCLGIENLTLEYPRSLAGAMHANDIKKVFDVKDTEFEYWSVEQPQFNLILKENELFPSYQNQIRTDDYAFIHKDWWRSPVGIFPNEDSLSVQNRISAKKAIDHIVVRIYRLWKDQLGETWFEGGYFLRPYDLGYIAEDSTHKWHPREVVYDENSKLVLPARALKGRCSILNSSTYRQGRPVDLPCSDIDYHMDPNPVVFLCDKIITRPEEPRPDGREYILDEISPWYLKVLQKPYCFLRHWENSPLKSVILRNVSASSIKRDDEQLELFFSYTETCVSMDSPSQVVKKLPVNDTKVAPITTVKRNIGSVMQYLKLSKKHKAISSKRNAANKDFVKHRRKSNHPKRQLAAADFNANEYANNLSSNKENEASISSPILLITSPISEPENDTTIVVNNNQSSKYKDQPLKEPTCSKILKKKGRKAKSKVNLDSNSNTSLSSPQPSKIAADSVNDCKINAINTETPVDRFSRRSSSRIRNDDKIGSPLLNAGIEDQASEQPSRNGKRSQKIQELNISACKKIKSSSNEVSNNELLNNTETSNNCKNSSPTDTEKTNTFTSVGTSKRRRKGRVPKQALQSFNDHTDLEIQKTQVNQSLMSEEKTYPIEEISRIKENVHTTCRQFSSDKSMSYSIETLNCANAETPTTKVETTENSEIAVEVKDECDIITDLSTSKREIPSPSNTTENIEPRNIIVERVDEVSKHHEKTFQEGMVDKPSSEKMDFSIDSITNELNESEATHSSREITNDSSIIENSEHKVDDAVLMVSDKTDFSIQSMRLDSEEKCEEKVILKEEDQNKTNAVGSSDIESAEMTNTNEPKKLYTEENVGKADESESSVIDETVDREQQSINKSSEFITNSEDDVYNAEIMTSEFEENSEISKKEDVDEFKNDGTVDENQTEGSLNGHSEKCKSDSDNDLGQSIEAQNSEYTEETELNPFENTKTIDPQVLHEDISDSEIPAMKTDEYNTTVALNVAEIDVSKNHSVSNLVPDIMSDIVDETDPAIENKTIDCSPVSSIKSTDKQPITDEYIKVIDETDPFPETSLTKKTTYNSARTKESKHVDKEYIKSNCDTNVKQTDSRSRHRDYNAFPGSDISDTDYDDNSFRNRSSDENYKNYHRKHYRDSSGSSKSKNKYVSNRYHGASSYEKRYHYQKPHWSSQSGVGMSNYNRSMHHFTGNSNRAHSYNYCNNNHRRKSPYNNSHSHMNSDRKHWD